MLACWESANTFLRHIGRVGLRYRAAGSTCGISPSPSLRDNRTAAGCASNTRTLHRPADIQGDLHVNLTGNERGIWKMGENTHRIKKSKPKETKERKHHGQGSNASFNSWVQNVAREWFYCFVVLVILPQWCIWLKGPLTKGDKHNTNGKTTPKSFFQCLLCCWNREPVLY